MSDQLPSLDTRMALTVPEAATALGVSERHLRSFLPDIPHVHLGGRVLIPVESLRRWLAARADAEAGGVEAAVNDILREIHE